MSQAVLFVRGPVPVRGFASGQRLQRVELCGLWQTKAAKVAL